MTIMANLTPAPKKLAPLKLAHGHKLRNGQIIGPALTIATKGAAKKLAPPISHPGMQFSEVLPDGRRATAQGFSKTSFNGTDVTTPRGPLKCGKCAPVKSGMTADRSKPIR
jgi:hypothetical protein